MRDLLTKTKYTRGIVWRGNYIWKQFQRPECDWMTSRSIVRLLGSESDYAGNASEVHTEGSRQTTIQPSNISCWDTHHS